LAGGERQQSQLDALIDALKPVIASSKDAKVKKAFDDATKVVTARAGAGNRGRGSYAAVRSAAQRVAVDANGQFEESPAQKRARELDDIFAKDRKEKTEAYRKAATR
jgi:hypothetical protein